MNLAYLLRHEPTLLNVGLLSGAASLGGTFGLSLSARDAAILVTVVTGLVHLVTAIQTAPVNVTLLHGAVTTLVVGAVSFGLHLQPGQIAVLSTVITAVLASLLREKVSPSYGHPEHARGG